MFKFFSGLKEKKKREIKLQLFNQLLDNLYQGQVVEISPASCLYIKGGRFKIELNIVAEDVIEALDQVAENLAGSSTELQDYIIKEHKGENDESRRTVYRLGGTEKAAE